jgi:hypothetical protein
VSSRVACQSTSRSIYIKRQTLLLVIEEMAVLNYWYTWNGCVLVGKKKKGRSLTMPRLMWRSTSIIDTRWVIYAVWVCWIFWSLWLVLWCPLFNSMPGGSSLRCRKMWT